MTGYEETIRESAGDDRQVCSAPIVVKGQLRHDLECPNTIYFTIRLKRAALRKARLACPEHLAEVIWDMQWNHGMYDGEYVITAKSWTRP